MAEKNTISIDLDYIIDTDLLDAEIERATGRSSKDIKAVHFLGGIDVTIEVEFKKEDTGEKLRREKIAALIEAHRIIRGSSATHDKIVIHYDSRVGTHLQPHSMILEQTSPEWGTYSCNVISRR